MLKDAEIAISMDGKGAWRDNVFVERLWRSVKYEEVYLRAYSGVSEARASIGRYLGFHNGPLPPPRGRPPPLFSRPCLSALRSDVSPVEFEVLREGQYRGRR